MTSELTHHAKILIVDDELANVRLLEKILAREGYLNVSMTTDSRDVANLFADNQPDLILLDLHMPHLNGFEIMDLLGKLIPEKTFLPIIVLTADATVEARRKALANGAMDLISKPFDNLEVALRIKNAVRTRFLHLDLENQNQILDERVRERTGALQETVSELHKAQQRVVQQERLRALGMMATGIAHDFNNILFLILAHSELLLNETESAGEDTKAVKYLRTIISAAQDGAQMVNRLAQFQRPPSETDLRQTIPLTHLIEQAVELTTPRWKGQAMAKGVDINVVTELAPIPDILGDQSEIREMLTNLIFNAVDAMPEGGTITLRTSMAGLAIVLEVEDTGVGMTEEIRERCLEPFFTTKGNQGSGLGLAMIYGIIQRLGGTLEIKTQPGRGTKFIVRLPTYHTVKVDEIAKPDSGCEPLAILVVDNQPVLCEVLAEYLQGDWHRVTIAHDGDEALKKFAAEKFDLVITDKAMPGMTGDQLAIALRKIRNDVPIILLTGFAESGISTSLIPEIDAVIGKPVNLTTLRHAIATAIADRREKDAPVDAPFSSARTAENIRPLPEAAVTHLANDVSSNIDEA